MLNHEVFFVYFCVAKRCSEKFWSRLNYVLRHLNENVRHTSTTNGKGQSGALSGTAGSATNALKSVLLALLMRSGSVRVSPLVPYSLRQQPSSI